MNKTHFYISNNGIQIPAILWGEPSNKLLIEIHGNLSNKEDTVISIMAEKAVAKGYQVLSFDLPSHGERTDNNYKCTPPICISDLLAVYTYAKTLAPDISLFACSIGAYFSLLAYNQFDLKQCLFLSPIVNMEPIIHTMMNSFRISKGKLSAEKVIFLPTGQTLEWDYYCFVKDNPVSFNWNIPTAILYGSRDNMSEWKEVFAFSNRNHAKITVLDDGEHYFHTDEQLQYFSTWIQEILL